MFLLFFAELVIEVLIELCLGLLSLNEVFDFRISISLQLGNEPLLVGFFLGLHLLFELLVGLVSCLLLLI